MIIFFLYFKNPRCTREGQRSSELFFLGDKQKEYSLKPCKHSEPIKNPFKGLGFLFLGHIGELLFSGGGNEYIVKGEIERNGIFARKERKLKKIIRNFKTLNRKKEKMKEANKKER